MKYLYHVTNKDNLKSILHWGLTPRIGDNSKRIGNTEKLLYLCDKESIPLWKILLGYDMVLKIKIPDGCQIKAYDYTTSDGKRYHGFTTTQIIRKENIHIIYENNFIDNEVSCMRHIAKDYLTELSRFCYYAAMIPKARYPYLKKFCLTQMKEIYRKIDPVLDNLNFSVCGPFAVRNYLIKYSNSGNYSLADHYFDTERRLYEMLIRYEYDDMNEERRRISDYIYDRLHMYIKDLNVGGLTD